MNSSHRFTDAADLVGEDIACRRGHRLIFAGVSWRLGAGGALILTGANGSGKSSLLRVLASLLPPASGRLNWGGDPIGDDLAAYRARLHYVGHLDAIKPALTPRETLGVWRSLRGLPGTGVAGDAAVTQALAVFGLEHAADWPSRWLSAGQRRRLALARLIAVPAPVWLLDEPSAALDGDGEARLEQAVAVHRAAGGRVVVATHTAIAIADAGALVLDDFAARDDDPWGDEPWAAAF